ncbi:hypothetical protein ACFPA8_07870 [Streptomyces ovatisporus]|uniref:Uncharacterized protein n=1 Tax=Streptomyces ovatisporus TaxID=1128682 RepID=A0ABV9A2C9_9ACTN
MNSAQREDRIETIYQGWGAREMAERIVELEEERAAVRAEALREAADELAHSNIGTEARALAAAKLRRMADASERGE